MALPQSEPKLMAEMLTTDVGPERRGRGRAAPPSTLAHGSGRAGSGCIGSSGGPGDRERDRA